MLVAAAVTAVGALIALVLLPSREAAGEATGETAAQPAVARVRTIEPVAVPSPA
jgi:hypothetical protein